MPDDAWLKKRSAELRERGMDHVREPLSRVRCGPRELALALGTGSAEPFVELATWGQAGARGEHRMVERGRVHMFAHELDRLIDRLAEARKRLARELRR